MQENAKKTWKSISKMERPKLVVPEKPGLVAAVPEKFIRYEDVKYLIYDRRPFCLLGKVLYTMHLIDVPSLGYALMSANFDTRLILMNPKYVTESVAMRILLGY